MVKKKIVLVFGLINLFIFCYIYIRYCYRSENVYGTCHMRYFQAILCYIKPTVLLITDIHEQYS